MTPRRTAFVLLVLAGSATVAACGTTTVVDVSTTAPTTSVVDVTTTTVPIGEAAELASRLSELAFSLSTSIADGKGKQAFATIEDVWGALKAQLRRTEFVDDLGDRIDFLRNAVERKRPADADKAAMHIRALVDAAQTELAEA